MKVDFLCFRFFIVLCADDLKKKKFIKWNVEKIIVLTNKYLWKIRVILFEQEVQK